jgi:glutathione peroxidase
MPDTRAARGGDGALDRAAPQDDAGVRVAAAAANRASSSSENGAETPLSSLTVVDVRGKKHTLAPEYTQGKKALLIFNSASACGYTKANWRGLVDLHHAYADRGLQVLAFPSNDFGKQEPLDGPELEAWARDTHAAPFPVFDKAPVIGADAQPVFRFLREQLQKQQGKGKEEGQKEVVTWNFWKFLVDPTTGRVVEAFDMPFRREQIERGVEALLQRQEQVDDAGSGAAAESEDQGRQAAKGVR